MLTEAHTPIPVITIGGFLGAGKTTLVNHLLAESQSQRMVVFVNDFGAINFDYDLIDTVEEDRVSLKNGCVCCTLNDDLVQAIVAYCRRGDPPDAFVIEASGVADPRSLDQSIYSLQQAGRVRLDSRVYVLDADQFGGLDYADTELLIDHAVASDIVLVNKTDLAPESRIDALRRILMRSSPLNEIVETTHCHVPLGILLGDGLMEVASQDVRSRPGSVPRRFLSHRYSSWSTTTRAPLDRYRFHVFASELSKVALRAKGHLIFSDDPMAQVRFDLVGNRETYCLGPRRPIDLASSLVAIGPCARFDRTFLENEFRRVLVPVEATD